MSWRVFLAGLLAWVLLPILAVGALCLWVGWQNGAPQTDLLGANISPAVVYTGGDTTLHFRFDGTALSAAQREPPLDIVFVIDVSQSVQNSIGELSAAVLATARGLARPGGDAPRFAVVTFSDQARTIIDWTEDANRLSAALQGLIAGGGTAFSNAAGDLDRLFASRTQRSGARVTLVVYTDGAFQDWQNASMYAAQLRSRGADLFVVGVPNVDLPAEVLEFVGNRPERVLETSTVSQLASQFLRLKQQLISGVAFDARLRVPLDGRHFAVGSQASSAWGSDGDAPVAYLGTLGQRHEEALLPLRPLTFGLWRVGTTPARLTYADVDGRVQQANATRPALLVLSVPLLLLAFLPVPLWSLLYLWTRPRSIRVPPPPPPIPSPAPAPELPVPSFPPLPRSSPVSTLLIGLGDMGGRCLQEVNEHVVRRGESRESLMLGGLWLHVARAAKEARSTDQAVVPSLAVTHLERVISSTPLPEHLAWFPQADYQAVPRASLSVENGCNGDRRLGRLALFQWLQEGDLETPLRDAIEALLLRTPGGAPCQVIVLAGAAGGFGGGTLIDVCRLVRRIASRAGASDATLPDVIPIVLGSDAIGRTDVVANLKALHDELETARLERTFPVPTAYRADEVDCGGLVPFDHVFWIVGCGEHETVEQAAALASILTDAHPRGQIVNQLSAAGQLLFVRTNAVLLLLHQLHALVGAELFLRVVGPEVVADIEPSPKGGYQPKVVTAGRAEELLHVLHVRAETAANGGWKPLWARVLGHFSGRTTPPLSDDQRAELPELTPDWLRHAICHAVNELLEGGDTTSGDARHAATTGAVAALLHLLAVRIGAGADEAARQLAVLDPQTLRDLADEVTAAAKDLDRWIEVACVRAGKAALAKQSAQQALGQSGQGGIKRIDPGALDPQSLPEMVDEALRRWLSQAGAAADPRSGSLRDYLHFRLLPKSNAIAVELAGLPDTGPDAAFDRLAGDVATLARTIGPANILERLEEFDERALQEVAAVLKSGQGMTSQSSFVVLPRHHKHRDPLVGRLLELVRERAGAGPQATCEGDDRTAVSRLSILPNDPSLEAQADLALPFAQAAEVAGERMRLRIQNTYSRVVPALPAPLRLALARRTAFQAFAAAFQAGRIVRRQDVDGIVQWFDQGSGAFLTTSRSPTLSEAAARFTVAWSPATPPPQPDPVPAADLDATLFAALQEWWETGDDRDGDALVLAATKCTS